MRTMVTPVLVGQGLQFAEGVNFAQDGTLYCVDIPGGHIWRMPPGGELRPWVATSGGPNGSRFGPGGDLFIADCVRRAILRVTPVGGEVQVYADRWEGGPFRGPNDLCFGQDGVLYFTDPAGSSLAERIGAVYAVSPGGAVTRVAAGLAFPNGIAVAPAGDVLTVAETHTGALRRFSLAQARRFEELPPLTTLAPARDGADEAGPDGMAFGADGNLYVAHYGSGLVRVIDRDGIVVADLPSGGSTPTNVAFWQESLYVTDGASGSIYRLDIGVREQPPFTRPW